LFSDPLHSSRRSIDELQPQFPGQREHHVLGLAVEFAHGVGAQLAQAVDLGSGVPGKHLVSQVEHKRVSPAREDADGPRLD
jgi:hypothetical protein